MGIVKGILQSKQPKAYKQITKNCLNLQRAGSLLKQTEPESAKGQSTMREGRIGNSCVVALLAASPGHALSWPGVPCSEYFSFLPQAFSCDLVFFVVVFLFFFSLWTFLHHWAQCMACVSNCPLEKGIFPQVYLSLAAFWKWNACKIPDPKDP